MGNKTPPSRCSRLSLLTFVSVLILFFGHLGTFPCFAEEAAPSQEASPTKQVTLTPVVVSGEATPDPMTDPLAPPPSIQPFVEQLTHEEIEQRQPRTVSDAMTYLAPNLVRTTQNRKYRRFFDSRGGKTSLVMDGMMIQDGSSNGGMRGDDRILDFLNPDIIQSIDWVKDSSGLIYGTSYGGIVNITTRKPGNIQRLGITMGEYGRRELQLTLSDEINPKFSYYTSLRSSEYKGPSGKNAQEEDTSAFLKLFWDPSDKDSLVFTYNRDYATFGIPIDEASSGMFNAYFKKAYWDNTTSLVKIANNGWIYGPWGNTRTGMDWTHRWNDRQTTVLQWDRLVVTNDFHNPRGIGASPIGHIDGHHVLETTTSYGLRHTAKFAHDWIARFGYLFDSWNNPTGKLYWENMANSDRKYAWFWQNEVPLMKDKLWLDFGIRKDHRFIVREQKSRLPKGAKAIDPITDEWEDPRTALAAGLSWKVNAHDRVAFRVGKSEVTPVDRYATFDSSPLANETDHTMNVSLDHNFLDKHQTTLSVDIFKNQLKNALVENTAQSRFVDAPTNSIAMRIFKNQTTDVSGGEFSLKTTFDRLDTKIGVGKTDFSPDILLNPNLNYQFHFRYSAPKDLTAEFYGRYLGPCETTVSLVTGKTAAGTPVNTTFPYKVNDFWDLNFSLRKLFHGQSGKSQTVTLMIRNLLDKAYETRPFTPDYGRMASLHLETDF